MHVETARIRFRKFTEHDFELLYLLDSNVEVMRFIRNGTPRTPQEVQEKLAEILAYYQKNEGLGVFAAFEKDSDQFMGWFCLKHLDKSKDIEIGYRILPQFWNKGFGSEGAKAMLDYGFEQGLQKICAVAHPENIASQAVMKRLGMEYIQNAVFYGAEVVYFATQKV